MTTYICPCGEPGCQKTYGHVRKDFILNAVNPDLESVPGLSKQDIERLKHNGITTTDHLVGHYFLCNRNNREFLELLEDLEITEASAQIISKKFAQKFDGI